MRERRRGRGKERGQGRRKERGQGRGRERERERQRQSVPVRSNSFSDLFLSAAAQGSAANPHRFSVDEAERRGGERKTQTVIEMKGRKEPNIVSGRLHLGSSA